MKFVILHAATAHEEWAKAASQLYLKKISAFFPCSEEVIRPRKVPREQAELKRKSDSEALLTHLQPDQFVIVFDERGSALDSKSFAKLISQGLGSSKKKIVFVIGGAQGFSDEVRNRANKIVSLGPMTLNHLLAMTVALEQIYRALTIINNLPYHNE